MLHLAALLLPLALAVPCVQFDANFNLYAFGGSQDVNLGSSNWAQPSVTPLTTSGRPPWTGNNTQCLLNQYSNAMYVLNADASNPSSIYIYNFGAGTWSTQTTSSVPSPLGNSRSSTVLDHDTNVFFTLSGNTLYQLDFGTPQITTTASSSAQAWSAVESPSFSTSGYTPTLAEASNHIMFFGVPGTAAGSADVFVVHYAYFQPTAQSFPTLNGGATFPDTPGQAISVPSSTSSGSAPNQMIFIPNDFSDTYLVSHWTNPSSYNNASGAPYATNLINTTQILPAPSSTDLGSSYAASTSALVQIDSGGNLYYINNAIGSDGTVQSGAAWQKMGYVLSGTGGTASNSTTASSGGSSTSAASMSGTMSVTQSGSSTASTSAGASTSKAAAGRVAELSGVLGGVAALIAAVL